jgi:hypothetical protein
MCAQEIRFQQMLLGEIVGPQQLSPAYLYLDNTGAIFLSKNQQVGSRTKHIEVRHHYIREMVDRGHIEVRFVNSQGQYGDIATKNVTEKIHEDLAEALASGNIKYAREDVGNHRSAVHHVGCYVIFQDTRSNTALAVVPNTSNRYASRYARKEKAREPKKAKELNRASKKGENQTGKAGSSK